MADLSVNIGELQMKNPVMTASGTFGYGEEFSDFIDIARIGGIIVKGTTLHKREGHPYFAVLQRLTSQKESLPYADKDSLHVCEESLLLQ